MHHPVLSSIQVSLLPCSLPPRKKNTALLTSHPFPLFPRSFCWDHRPQVALDVAPRDNMSCVICMEPVGDRLSYSTMACSACRTAWFHRSCIQENAKHAGIMCFMCPACRERDVFVVEMMTMGILIPSSLPSWITDPSPASEERHSHCDARECLCPGGREQVEEEGPWQLLLCCSCAAEGTHRACSSLGDSTTSWQCAGCAGPSIASSVTAVLGGSSSPSQEAAGASRISPALESSDTAAPRAESISPSQTAMGPTHSLPAPETRGEGSTRQLPSEASRSSPVLESGRRSTPTGPMRVRDRSRSRRRAQNPYTRPRQRRDRRHSAAPQADSSESSSPSQVASEASSPSRVLQSGRRSTRSGSLRLQDRSRSGRRAQTPDSQPRQSRGRSHRAAPRAESSSPSQTAAGASRSSTAGNSGHRSRTGPVRVRDRSRLQRRAQRPYSRHR
ncbi:serine/arginine repetitive matrix protein 4-like [Heliangelus exortis]|uniref:serine/arginine repetitive matrix protein 4-like n=1 Tax=Heliangelus exortis TaxID=472823 RepID=UPI003A922027